MERLAAMRTIWVSELERIVFFHSVDGYRKMDFCQYDHYMEYLQILTGRGFRFQ